MKRLFSLLILVLFVPILFLDFSTDANVYAYIGRVIFNGGVPYVDAWDHKGISLYLINALGYGVFGFKSFIGIRILELILIFYAFSRFFTYTSRKYSKLIATIAGVFGLFTFRYFFDGGNLTEEYGAIFSLLSVLLLLKKEVKTMDYALVGAFFVINFTIRANLISFWVALFLVYIIQLIYKERSIKQVLLNFLKMGYGALTIAIILVAYLLITNSFNAFVDAAFTFNFSYSNSTLSSTFNGIITSMKTYYLSIILIIGFLVSVMRFLKDRSRFIELLLIFWIPIELYFGNVSNRLYAHYFLMWMPLIVLSMIIILSELKERFQISDLKTIVGCLLVFSLLYYVPSYMSLTDWKKVVQNKETKYEKIGKYVNENYSDDSLLVWGNSTFIYNQTNKITPITYFYQSIFKYDTELTRKKMKEFTSQIQERSPQIMIDTNDKGFVRLNGANLSTIDQSQKDGLGEFLDIMKTKYQYKEEKFGFTFYELKEDE